ncbi:MAG TPA: hypothetical protein VIX90_11310 [Edaphobacter sp.]
MTVRRHFTPILALTFTLLLTLAARAQVSAYGSAALANYVFFNNNASAAKSDTGGIIGGAFYNFPIHSRLTAGIDARGSYGLGDRGGTFAAAALRIGFVPERVALRPYFQIGGGLVSSTFSVRQLTGPVIQGLTIQPTRYTSGGVQFAAGLDLRLSHAFDLRAFELGAIAPVNSTGSVGSAWLTTGVVYHLPRLGRTP